MYYKFLKYLKRYLSSVKNTVASRARDSFLLFCITIALALFNTCASFTNTASAKESKAIKSQNIDTLGESFLPTVEGFRKKTDRSRDRAVKLKDSKGYDKYKEVGYLYASISGGISNSLTLQNGNNISNSGGLFSGVVGGTVGLSLGYNFNVVEHFQLGFEIAGRWFFQNTNIVSITPAVTVNSSGQQFIGAQIIPALTFNDNKYGIFLIAGVGYTFMTANSNTSASTYNLNGIGVMYGLGAFVKVQDVISFFIRGISFAPITRNVTISATEILSISIPAYAIEVGVSLHVI
jgi:hypothetical protein